MEALRGAFVAMAIAVTAMSPVSASARPPAGSVVLEPVATYSGTGEEILDLTGSFVATDPFVVEVRFTPQLGFGVLTVSTLNGTGTWSRYLASAVGEHRGFYDFNLSTWDRYLHIKASPGDWSVNVFDADEYLLASVWNGSAVTGSIDTVFLYSGPIGLLEWRSEGPGHFSIRVDDELVAGVSGLSVGSHPIAGSGLISIRARDPYTLEVRSLTDG